MTQLVELKRQVTTDVATLDLAKVNLIEFSLNKKPKKKLIIDKKIKNIKYFFFLKIKSIQLL